MSETESSDDGGGLRRKAILGALGIGGGTWAALAGFASDLAEADSLRELVLEIILTEVVNGILSLAEFAFTEVLNAIDVISTSFWLSVVAPFGELYDAYVATLLSPLTALRLSVESAVASTGLAAPFVAIAGWVVVLFVVVAIASVGWAILETYLPTEAITENTDRIFEAARLPLDVAGRLLRGAVRVVRGETSDGGSDE